MSKKLRLLLSISLFLLVSISANGIIVKSVFASAAIQSQQQERQRQQQQNQQNTPQQQRGRLPPTEQTQQESSDVMDLVDIWRELDYSSEVWLMIIDRTPKEITIREYIKLYRERGININKPASHYVNFIDGLLYDRKELLNSPFEDVLRFAAVLEYDFDNGQNKDEMALRVLGENVYKENKRRLGY